MAKPTMLTYNLQSLFHKYRDESLLARLENYALWTIPSVFPREEHYYNYQNRQIEYDGQSINAGLVNQLATKLASTLFPANTSFFRLEISEPVKRILKEHQINDVIAYENKASERLFLNASYAQLIQALRFLIVTGECLIYRVNDALRVYSLRDYTVKRSNTGDVLDMVIRDHKYFSELPADVQQLIGHKPHDHRIKMYTRVKRCGKNGFISWRVTQEIDGKPLPTDVTYRDKLCPYIPVVWSFVNGDNYGRGHVEDYAADIYKLSRLSGALTDYQFDSMRTLNLVDPTKPFDVRSAEEAPTGEFIQGTADAVTPYETGDYQKMQVVMASLSEIEQRLNRAFMNTSNQRDAERVTAYEIRLAAEEAEQVLGGVYSQLSQSLHLPLAYLLLNEANDQIITDIDRQNIKLEILTGLQALSRSSENQSLVIAASEMNAVLPMFSQQMGLSPKWNLDKIAEGILSANGVNIESLQYSEQELQAIQEAQQAQSQQQAQMQMMQGAAAGGQLAGQESAVDAVTAARTY